MTKDTILKIMCTPIKSIESNIFLLTFGLSFSSDLRLLLFSTERRSTASLGHFEEEFNEICAKLQSNANTRAACV